MFNNFSKIILLIIIFLGGFSLRIFGIDYGLPFLYDPDEPTFITMVYKMLITDDLHPGWFGHPGTTLVYILYFIYKLTFIIGTNIGVYTNFEAYKLLYFQDPTLFYLTGRIICALFGSATILIVYLITRRLLNHKAGLLASALLAISPLHIMYSKLIRTDIILTFFIVVVFWYTLNIFDRRKWSDYILAGLFSGLAIATKYPGLIAVIIIIAAYLLNKEFRDLPKIISSGFACIFGAFLGSPYLFLDFRTALSDIIIEARPRHLSQTGEGFIHNLYWYIKGPLLENVSFIGLIIVFLGLIICIVSRKKDKRLLIVFPICFLLFISSLNLRFDRWIIPFIPFFYMIMSICFYWIVGWISLHYSTRVRNAIACILLLAVFAPILRADLIKGKELSGKDTRTVAREWMLENIPLYSRVLVEEYSPHIPSDRYSLLVIEDKQIVEINRNKIPHLEFRPSGKIANLKNQEEIYAKEIEYIILSNWYDRFLADSRFYPQYIKKVKKYEAIMEKGTTIFEISNIPGINMGPRIRIYSINFKKQN